MTRRPFEVVRATWDSSGPASTLLAPLALAYGAGVALRRLAFRIGARRSRRAGVPVVSVGNLSVGGTGKTPAALWLGEALRADGARPAIVTRGYGGSLGGRTVTAGVDGRALLPVEEIGDEAALLAERFAGPVVCGADRVAAARRAVEAHGVDAIVLDDGFQHWRLARDFDLVLIDGRRGLGNGALLPAGPLREPPSALARADAIVVTKAEPSERLEAVLSRHAAQAAIYRGRLAAEAVVRSEAGRLVAGPLGDLLGRRVVTVSAIAEPESFYDLLGELDARAVEVLEFPDHHVFSQEDWQQITQASQRADLVVCTEKDLVKLRKFPFARGRLVALRVAFRLEDGEERRLRTAIRERLRIASRGGPC